MEKRNIFGQPINEAERTKNSEMISDLLKKMEKRREALSTVRECNQGIAEYDEQMKEKRVLLNNSVDMHKAAEEVAEKAFKEAREKNAGKGPLVLSWIFAILVVATTVYSLILLFPMIKDHMDMTVVLLLVGAPVVLLILMPVTSYMGGEKKRGLVGKLIDACKEGWNGTDSNKEDK